MRRPKLFAAVAAIVVLVVYRFVAFAPRLFDGDSAPRAGADGDTIDVVYTIEAANAFDKSMCVRRSFTTYRRRC
jgi:hypothetical protein